MNFEFSKNLKERLITCKKCKNKHYDIANGIVCGLHGKKPTFNNDCPDFIVDKEEERKIKNTLIISASKPQELKESLLLKTISNYNLFFRKKIKKKSLNEFQIEKDS